VLMYHVPPAQMCPSRRHRTRFTDLSAPCQRQPLSW
jgi:hypothetical protein